MSGLRMNVFKAGLEALYLTGAHRMLRPFVGGVGAILMLHHVRPAERREFAPNSLLEVTPEFLDGVVARESGRAVSTSCRSTRPTTAPVR